MLLQCALLLVYCTDSGRPSQNNPKPENSLKKTAPAADTIGTKQDSSTVATGAGAVDFNRIDSLLTLPAIPGSISERVDFFSRCFLGTPFSGESPTGEGRYDTVDTAPVYNINSFDCLTYVEHVLALALSGNARSFLPHLVRLRYRDDCIDYLHRNHFFETDWLANNKDLITLIPPKKGVVITRTISKTTFFARKRLKVSIPDTVISVNAWPVEGFLAALDRKSIDPGIYLIAFIKNRHIRVMTTHVGFAVINSGAAYLRDANKTRGKVSESDLKKYLNHNAPVLEGLLLARITDRADPRRQLASGAPY
jgi:hypothetical protein